MKRVPILCILLLCMMLTPVLASSPMPEQSQAVTTMSSEKQTGVGNVKETTDDEGLSPETKKLIVAAAGSGVVAGGAMIYIFRRKSH